MNERAIEELRKTEADLLAQLQRVRTALAALTGSPAGSAVPGETSRPDGKKRQRAPRGLLDKMLVANVERKPGCTSGELFTALKDAGYTWPLTPEYVSKALMKLKDAKRVAMRQEGSRYEYHPKS